MVKTRRRPTMTAAERRLRALAPAAPSLNEAVGIVVADLMEGVTCPPTDLAGLGAKVGVQEISYEDFPGSGELHKIGNGYRIVCSAHQSPARQRFTIAHELAHAIVDRTGRNAPRAGSSVERICDMVAAECLMPRAEFDPRLPAAPRSDDIERLASVFGTSIRATAIRCAELRGACIFEVNGERVMWGYGGVRAGAVMYLLDQVRDGVKAVMAGARPAPRVYFYGDGRRASQRQFEWINLGADSALFMLVREDVRNLGSSIGDKKSGD